MAEVSPGGLKQAVESQHGGKATLVQSVPVREMRGEQVAWEATVSVFDLAYNPRAKRAYAWSWQRDDGSRSFFAVLHAPTTESPADAVRAAMAAEPKGRR
jgi:hypothetical protein